MSDAVSRFLLYYVHCKKFLHCTCCRGLQGGAGGCRGQQGGAGRCRVVQGAAGGSRVVRGQQGAAGWCRGQQGGAGGLSCIGGLIHRYPERH